MKLKAGIKFIGLSTALIISACSDNASQTTGQAASNTPCDVGAITADDTDRVLNKANDYLTAKVETVTANTASRSAGGPNDFYSEGDYWWPVPGDPDAPYERRDGQTNPDNFTKHRLSMIRFSDIQGSLASAYLITGQQKYADAAATHLKAWFIDADTRMNPNLLYAQAIKGRHTGRSIGIIDTLHLVEVARAAKLLGDAGAIDPADYASIKTWFNIYAKWMNTHPNGIKERDWHNNHSIAWSLQIAAFADLTGDAALTALVKDKFKNIYLADMMDANGGFPKELSRTKPYGYSLFVIDLMAGIAQITSTREDDLWRYSAANGQSMSLGLDFIKPYVTDKSLWPYAQDVMYWDDWPVRHPSLLLAGDALGDCSYYDTVKDLAADSDVYEVRRNFPLRHPLIWMN